MHREGIRRPRRGSGALIERGELIGDELEEVFEAADAANPDAAAPFERRLFTLPKLFEEPGQGAPGASEWPADSSGAAAASWELLGEPGSALPSRTSWTLYLDPGQIPPDDFHAPPKFRPGDRPPAD